MLLRLDETLATLVSLLRFSGFCTSCCATSRLIGLVLLGRPATEACILAAAEGLDSSVAEATAGLWAVFAARMAWSFARAASACFSEAASLAAMAALDGELPSCDRETLFACVGARRTGIRRGLDRMPPGLELAPTAGPLREAGCSSARLFDNKASSRDDVDATSGGSSGLVDFVPSSRCLWEVPSAFTTRLDVKLGASALLCSAVCCMIEPLGFCRCLLCKGPRLPAEEEF